MKNRIIRQQLRQKLIKSFKGWLYWHRLVKSHNLENSKVILFPSDNKDEIYFSLLYLNQFIEKSGSKSALILSINDIDKSIIELFTDKIIDVIKISDYQLENIIQLYSLFEFDSRFIVASLTLPQGRNVKNLIGKNNITIEDIIAIGIYHLEDYKKETSPKYEDIMSLI